MRKNKLITIFDLLELGKCTYSVDISDAIDCLLKNIDATLNDYPELQLQLGRTFSTHDPGAGWDTEELFFSGNPGKYAFKGKVCGISKQCQDTVTLWRGCDKICAVSHLS